MTIENTASAQTNAREWVKVLAMYRDPNPVRSGFELGVSLVPFLALWVLACWVAQYSYLGAFMISLLNGGFLLRLFCIQHDCGHGSFFGIGRSATGPGGSLASLR